MKRTVGIGEVPVGETYLKLPFRDDPYSFAGELVRGYAIDFDAVGKSPFCELSGEVGVIVLHFETRPFYSC
jgi:hypothetical protein